jgi:hypothetical protein
MMMDPIPHSPALPNLPSVPPTTPIPISVVVYEGLRLVPHLMAEAIIGSLLYSGKLGAEVGIMALLAVLMGQLFPRRTASMLNHGG